MLPSADVVARRAELRGLGKELIRMDYDQDLRKISPMTRNVMHPRYKCSFRCGKFIQVADSDLHHTLKPYRDPRLVEAHGEQLLELYIGLASELDWKEWMRASVEVAASDGNLQVFRRLLGVGPSVSELSAPDSTWALSVLCQAARGGSTDIFFHLVAIDGFLKLARGDPGQPEDQPNSWDRHLLTSAACGGNVAILAYLLDTDDGFLVLVDMRNDVDDGLYATQVHSPLHVAAAYGHARFAAALIEVGAPLEYRFKLYGGKGETALETAAFHGHEGVVLELLSAGADINMPDVNTTDFYVRPQRPLLTIAADQNHEGVVDVLLAAGAALGEDRTDIIPLHAAAKKGHCEAMEKLLLAGANASWVDSKGRSALHAACMYTRVEAVEILLRFNASVTLLCDEGLSPQDAVAVETIAQKQTGARGNHAPSTLDTAQASAAGRIRGMLRKASAWGRRGWLVVLRARHQGATKAVDASSPTMSSLLPLRDDQIAFLDAGQRNDDAGHGSTSASVRCDSSVAAPAPADMITKHTVPSGGPSDEMKKSILAKSAMVDNGHGSGGHAKGIGWQGAVEWLIRCQDERGVFREILSFL
eukprot:g7125.t2